MRSKQFKLLSEYQPRGDQPQAIKALVDNFRRGKREQVLLGATGTGKTYTMAQVIQKMQKPTLVMAHNKTLAAQLCSEFKEFFPENAVEYFVSYYDYYQPEAYLPHTDTYIEKDASRNEEIEKLRHAATAALLERPDVIVVASVSCIYGLGSPAEYREQTLALRLGQLVERDFILQRLTEIQYERNDFTFVRGTFRVRGDLVEIYPASFGEKAVRVELFGDEVERIVEVNPLTGEILAQRRQVSIFPANHYVTGKGKIEQALLTIEEELAKRLLVLRQAEYFLAAQRLEQRTRYDLELMREIGFCSGIENYARHLTGRQPGEAPDTLIDFFPDDFLLMVDESHVTLPQVGAMYAGDRSRKKTLVEHGFRLPSALDNRPLRFAEFIEKLHQVVYVSATPRSLEIERSEGLVIEQINRPTGLLDPEIFVRPTKGQIDDLLEEIKIREKRKERVLITTLTKKMAEDLTDYLREMGVRVRYLHSEVKTLERMQIIRDLRLGTFDVLVGINLLREGLDLPEVSLVVILDADQEGFLRSERALLQTMGRAARHVQGQVIMYADRWTDSMQGAITETERRRTLQKAFNQRKGIVPQTVQKGIRDVLEATLVAEEAKEYELDLTALSATEKAQLISRLEKEMQGAARELAFERAAELRDLLFELKK